jgi:thioredoxin-related protein
MESSTKPRTSVVTQWGPALLILGVLAFYLYASRPAGEPPGWGHDYAAALAEAKSSGRKVLLAFHSDGCPPCTAMDRTTLRAEAVQDSLTGLVPVRINAWNSPDISSRYGVSATPTYIVAQSDGTAIRQAEGFLTESEFVLFLNSAM